jgi:hypothetical protein
VSKAGMPSVKVTVQTNKRLSLTIFWVKRLSWLSPCRLNLLLCIDFFGGLEVSPKELTVDGKVSFELADILFRCSETNIYKDDPKQLEI